MHSTSLKGALAIILATATFAAHGASVTVRQGTNTITSEQDGDPADSSLSIEKSSRGSVLRQRSGGNSVDFTVGGKGNSVVTAPDTTTDSDEE